MPQPFHNCLNPLSRLLTVAFLTGFLIAGPARSVFAQDSPNDPNNLRLWYARPAATWTEALPVGNGRLGAMVFGKVNEELIQLNESTLWSGGPAITNANPAAPGYLPQIREALLKQEDYQKAIQLAKRMQGPFTESYMPLGDLLIKQDFTDTNFTGYYRDLNIRDAVTTTRFTIGGTEYTRQLFVSAPDQVIIIRLLSGRPGQLNFQVTTRSQLPFQNSAAGKDEWIMNGKAPVHADPSYYNGNKQPVLYEDPTGCNGMRFQLRVKVLRSDGTTVAEPAGIRVQNASEVILLLSAATSFNGFDKCPDKDGKDEKALAGEYLDKAMKKGFPALLKNHLADFHTFFDRVSIELKDSTDLSAGRKVGRKEVTALKKPADPKTGSANRNVSLPSDERLKSYSDGVYDPGVEALYFQYGRYLLISSSRPGGTPANLQGIWNKELRAPWSSNFTININTQMNYWPAEVTNLPEMHAPLFDLIKELSVTGKVTAAQYYNMKGWVAHHNTDIWALSNPVGDGRQRIGGKVNGGEEAEREGAKAAGGAREQEPGGDGDPRWANWAQGGNWLCRHLWEHYCYTGDKQFLRETAYPVMKGAATFCLDWLVQDKDGWLVVAPSVSPENVFNYAKGKESDISVATTMDMSIVWDLFTNLIDASSVLRTDVTFRDLLIAKRKKLFPLHIGKKGNLQEWNKDWEDVEVHHRHVSHLFGLYPGRQIAPLSTPEFAAAARKTLEIRGDDGTGWSKAWKINFWARLLDGNHAYLLLRQLLHATSENSYNYAEGGGTYPNFFDAHPPFQIDGNFGGTSGMAEMLIQSHLADIHLLPALPDAWKEGHIKGLKARGNFEVSMDWKDHKLKTATIKSVIGGTCQIRTSVPVRIEGKKGRSVRDANGFLLVFPTQKGEVYTLIAL